MHKFGENHSNSKLNNEDVLLIKQLVEERKILKQKFKNLSDENIAKKFSVSRSAIRDIREGKRWGHVQLPINNQTKKL